MWSRLPLVHGWRDPDVKRIACGVALLLITCSPLRAQDKVIDELKGKIFDARMAQQTFGEGLKYCPELNGKTSTSGCAIASSISRNTSARSKAWSRRRSSIPRSG